MKFSDIESGSVPPETIQAIRRTGVAVVRGVVPKNITEGLLTDVRDYFSKHKFKGFPSDTDKKVQLVMFRVVRYHADQGQVVYESYWSSSQVKARSHPNMLATQAFMNQLYTADADQKGTCCIRILTIESSY